VKVGGHRGDEHHIPMGLLINSFAHRPPKACRARHRGAALRALRGSAGDLQKPACLIRTPSFCPRSHLCRARSRASASIRLRSRTPIRALACRPKRASSTARDRHPERCDVDARRETSDPRSLPQAIRQRVAIAYDAIAAFPIATPKPDRDEALRMVVKITAPIVADKLVQVDLAPSRRQQGRAVHVRRAAMAAVDFLGDAEEPVEKCFHLPSPGLCAFTSWISVISACSSDRHHLPSITATASHGDRPPRSAKRFRVWLWFLSACLSCGSIRLHGIALSALPCMIGNCFTRRLRCAVYCVGSPRRQASILRGERRRSCKRQTSETKR
jgi:hypothetical protein